MQRISMRVDNALNSECERIGSAPWTASLAGYRADATSSLVRALGGITVTQATCAQVTFQPCPWTEHLGTGRNHDMGRGPYRCLALPRTVSSSAMPERSSGNRSLPTL